MVGSRSAGVKDNHGVVEASCAGAKDNLGKVAVRGAAKLVKGGVVEG